MANSDEADKQIVAAAEAVLTAAEQLGEARSGLEDQRFGSDKEADRQQAFQAALRASENTVRRLEEALRKAAVTGAVLRVPGTFAQFRAAQQRLEVGRSYLRAAPNVDGTPAKYERLRAAYDELSAVLEMSQVLVFPMPPPQPPAAQPPA